MIDQFNWIFCRSFYFSKRFVIFVEQPWIEQVCCKDLWYLEVEVPPVASRVSLVRASTTTLEVCWTATPTAQAYILEVQKIESMPPPQPLPVNSPVAVVKKQQSPAILAGNQKTIVKHEIKQEIKQELLSPKTPIRSPAHAAAASSMSILTTNTATSSPILQSINSSSLAAHQGQPIIITTSAPIPNLVSNTIVRIKSAINSLVRTRFPISISYLSFRLNRKCSNSKV